MRLFGYAVSGFFFIAAFISLIVAIVIMLCSALCRSYFFSKKFSTILSHHINILLRGTVCTTIPYYCFVIYDCFTSP